MATQLEKEVDSERLGIRVASAHVLPESLSHVLEFCSAERINLLIARCSTKEIRGIP